MGEEIIYKSDCQMCEQHTTEKGIWESIKKSIEDSFCVYSEENKVRIMIAWFEQTKLDERTQMIQGFKKTNIKEINKNGHKV
jgi:hypothetical protein